MKIFISHSSADKEYGHALVKFFREVGVPAKAITFTSDPAYGITPGANMFDWLKEKMVEQPLVIFLLSPKYYESIACLNEMGAAWIIGNRRIPIFTPDFDLGGRQFQSGALDPRSMGFFINDKDRVEALLEILVEEGLSLSHTTLTRRAVEDLIKGGDAIAERAASRKAVATPTNTIMRDSNKPGPLEGTGAVTQTFVRAAQSHSQVKQIAPTPSPRSNLAAPVNNPIPPSKTRPVTLLEKLEVAFEEGRLIDEEILLLYYVSEQGLETLGTGSKERDELQRIQDWESVKGASPVLSSRYSFALRRFKARKWVTVADVTGYGNPRLMGLVPELMEILFELPHALLDKAEQLIEAGLPSAADLEDEIPF